MFRLEDTVTFSTIESHKWRKNVNDCFRQLLHYCLEEPRENVTIDSRIEFHAYYKTLTI